MRISGFQRLAGGTLISLTLLYSDVFHLMLESVHSWNKILELVKIFKKFLGFHWFCTVNFDLSLQYWPFLCEKYLIHGTCQWPQFVIFRFNCRDNVGLVWCSVLLSDYHAHSSVHCRNTNDGKYLMAAICNPTKCLVENKSTWSHLNYQSFCWCC